MFLTLTLPLVLALVAWATGYVVGKRAGERRGHAAALRQRVAAGDTPTDLIASALSCVDESLDPLSTTLPWTRPHLRAAQKELNRAFEAETSSLTE